MDFKDLIDSRHVKKAITESNIPAREIPVEEARRIRETIESKYAEYPNGWLWDRLVDYSSRRRYDGWKLACEYVGDREVILFLDRREGEMMWELQNGSDLCCVIGECPPIEFYLTDANTSYVLCLNHHDYLIGAGACKPWLEQIEPKIGPSDD